MTFNPLEFKSQFPLFDQAENQSLVYLDNAATTQKPQCVIDAIVQFYLHQNGNAQRASHRLARAATEMVEETRMLAADFLGAHNTQEVVFTQGATEALNIIAYGLADYCVEGNNIVVSHAEHHANLLPWQRLAQEKNCNLVFVPQQQGVPIWGDWASVVDAHTKIIALSAASNVTGACVDLSVISAIKHAFPDIVVVVDASQISCHLVLQAADWQCDFLVCSAHKFYGPTGIGLLYGKTPWFEQLKPLLVGGEMVDKAGLHTSRFAASAQRLEAGTSPLSAIAGLRACLQFFQQQDRAAMLAHEQQLTQYLHRQLTALCDKYQSEGLLLISVAENNAGIATLIANSSRFSMSDLAYYLDEQNIAVRVGDHCAQPLWQSLMAVYGVDKGLRLSIAAYNQLSDIDQLVAAIKAFFTFQDSSPLPTTDNVSTLDWQELLTAASWQKRYKVLLRWGGCISRKPSIRQECYQVKGCESLLWLQHTRKGDHHYFLIDSDTNIIKGLVAVLLFWLNGKTSEQINSINITEKFQALGLEKHLSTSRMNGFLTVLNKMKSYL